ncbi:MAG: alpha/beta hydrolase [Actinomycetia bacterium]|nr:alpha/beta hydrolase [Actinomycetes bacterium]MCP4962521.1 alpha/beta hydrolase [Actinomycetes bacterium]
MNHTESSFTASDGKKIYHQSWVPDSDSSAVVMVVHGLGEHSGRYQHVAETLVAAGCAVHALDHRGHGKSDGKRTFVKSYDEFLVDLAQYRSIIEGEHPGVPMVVLGHSMGGNIAVGHALDNQAGIAGLAVSGAALKVGDDFSPLKLKIFEVVAKIAPGLRPEGLSVDAISRDPAVVEAYKNDPLVFTGKISAGLGAALIGAMKSFPARYSTLTLPLWIGHGTEDQLADVAGSRELEAGAVNAKVTAHYYEGLYHEIFNEPEQDRVLADLVAWIESTTS